MMSEVVKQARASNSDGVVTLTQAAMQHVVTRLADRPQTKGIRLSVKKTGCSGLSYVVDYVETPLANDIIAPLQEGLLIFIDKVSYPYLKGTQIDYIKQGLNCKFVFKNPNQTGQCGCGESFTV